MRIQSAAGIIALILIVSGCSKRVENNLIGEWKGTDYRGQPASLVLNRDLSVRLVMGNLVVDGAVMGGGGKVKWRVNSGREPTPLDVIIILQTGQEAVVPMIVRFITDRKLQLRIDPDMQSRPTGFSAEDTENQVVLVKQ